MGIGWSGLAIVLGVFVAISLLLFYVSVRVVAGFWPSYWQSLFALFVAMLGSYVGLMSLGAMPQLPSWFEMLLSVGIELCVLAGAVRWLVRRADGVALAWGRSLGVAALYIALCFALVAAVALLLFGQVPGLPR